MNAVFEKKEYFRLHCLTVKGFRGYLPMFHPHGELVYVSRGSLPITVDGVSHTLHQGEVALLFPYLPHSYDAAPDSHVTVALFDPAATVFDNTLLSKKPVSFHTHGSHLEPLMTRMVTLSRMEREKTAMAYLNAVIGELLEVMPLEHRDSTGETSTAQILTWCAEHFAEEISVKAVADALYISQSYVSKIFSQKLRCGFREYINNLRVHKAQNLLERTDLQIAQIMSQCGFRNQSSFNRVFRDICGTSPREYRIRQDVR